MIGLSIASHHINFKYTQMKQKHKPRKRPRSYTINCWEVGWPRKKKEIKTFDNLVEARKTGNQLNRQGRFISLTNIKGILLCL